MAPPAIVVGGVLLRTLGPEDSAAMVEAVNGSLEHLRPFMRWAQEPADEEKTALRLALAAAAMEAGGDVTYGVFASAEPGAPLVGSCGLHDVVADRAANIGYWVHAAWTGRGIAGRAASALARLAFETFGLDAVEIHCDEANRASAGVARRLGFSHVRTVDGGPGAAPGDAGRTMVWQLTAGEWPASAAAAAASDLRIETQWRSPPTC